MGHFVLRYDGYEYDFIEAEDVSLYDIMFVVGGLLNEVFFRWMMVESISPEEKKQLLSFTIASMEQSFMETYKDYLPGGDKKGLGDTLIN